MLYVGAHEAFTRGNQPNWTRDAPRGQGVCGYMRRKGQRPWTS
jgi:hypothetical protein